MSNPLPLSRTQLSALLAAVAWELGGGLQAAADEMRAWRRRAETIPDPVLRSDALHALDHKRGHLVGATLFWILPARRDPNLLRVLVAYELIQDYLDGASERGAMVQAGSGPQLYLALADAVDPDRPLGDYYRDHPWKDDGGFLCDLVQACRAGSRLLPSFDVVRPLLAREATRAVVLDLNHEPDATRRDAALREWAGHAFPGEHGLHWFELTAAASGWITTHALLAIAAETGATSSDVLTRHDAYFPWFALTLTMLDSLVDQEQDARAGDHNYLTHYPSADDAILRICTSIDRSASDVLALPHGERHAVLLACMIALYLSKDSARSSDMRRTTKRVLRSSGSLPRLLLPALRIWRLCNAQRAGT